MDREELRNELSAVIAAAHELPREDEGILIDGFLERLEPAVRLYRGSRRRPLPAGRERSVSFRRAAPALLLVLLVPALAFGNPGVSGQPGFWCAWLAAAIVFGLVLLRGTFGTTLNYDALIRRNRLRDDLG